MRLGWRQLRSFQEGSQECKTASQNINSCCTTVTGTPLALLTSLPAVAGIAAARAAARGEGAAAAAGQPIVCVEEHVFAHWLHACSRGRRQLQHRVCTLKSTRAAQNRTCKGTT